MAKDSSKNWFRVYRDLLSEELWTSERFTTGQAWIDLIGMANYADTERIYKGQLQKIQRGQIYTSIRFLAQRWHWSRAKTERTIKMMEKAQMLTVKTTTNGTVLTLENYGKYQGDRATNKATNLATNLATTLATDLTQKKKVKKDKEGEERARETQRDPMPAALSEDEVDDGWVAYRNGKEIKR